MNQTKLNLEKKPFSINLENYKRNNYSTHGFHPYPAKFIPQIAKELILQYSNENDWILDPFCGSGTTLVESKLNQRNAIGVDINPLSSLISKVKSTKIDESDFSKIEDFKEKVLFDINNKNYYKYPHFHNINHWFKDFIQKEISIVLHHLNSIDESDVRDLLSVALSSIIVKVSNQDSDTRYTAIEKKLYQGIVFKELDRALNKMSLKLNEFNQEASNKIVKVFNDDSRKISSFVNNKIDTVITSPPYVNSYDYYLYHKHRMNWLNLDYKKAQSGEFGSRNKHSDNNAGIDEYELALETIISEIRKVQKNKGYFCMVIGDGIIKGELIKANKISDNLMEKSGYTKVQELAFDQRKYTRTFTPNIKTKFKNSYILIYQAV
ncbi:site-specific DNA-methyltransferase (cytosine-N4-specific) [Zunongwangia mangrovi]|uniref:Methyltransferase n=1 Tax=Zunongwangia mangrovi TaxID=1334022 RepID=A0A1I1DKW7_9FLAO|nr:DNA methyltransferase [Zunongwangia mangrovi]SFB75625.1 site-specific DNA-methyltransferase (cytosine-N4-specific) [Zunongwangia mangrovi]